MKKNLKKNSYDSVDCNIVGHSLEKKSLGTTVNTNTINVQFLTLAVFLFTLPHSKCLWMFLWPTRTTNAFLKKVKVINKDQRGMSVKERL